ncbi:putative sensor histidine kinase pdtaS [compost metagenome]
MKVRILFWLCFTAVLTLYFPTKGFGENVVKVNTDSSFKRGIRLNPHIEVYEDAKGLGYLPDSILSHPELFTKSSKLKPVSAISIYWVKATIKNEALTSLESIIAFSNLSFVDLYVYESGKLLESKKSGTFRPIDYIDEADGREYFTLNLQEGHTYTLLFKIHHIKHYQPKLNFTIQNQYEFLKKLNRINMINMFLNGSVAFFFIYILFSWILSRYRPYLWLMIYITGCGLYGISMNGYFIDWAMPFSPATGWLFNVQFINIGLFGIAFLFVDFWNLRTVDKLVYRLFIGVIICLLTVSIIDFIVTYKDNNYKLMNQINLPFIVVSHCFILWGVIRCFPRLTRGQRFLAYGFILHLLTSIITSSLIFVLNESSIRYVSYVGNASLVIVIIFSLGLKEELRQFEIDKNEVLQRLNLLQLDQNQLLDKMVLDRTIQLELSNTELATRQSELAERNKIIETLMQELQHRVKNNLQLLYSLINLQLPIVKDVNAKDLLKNNLGRIKAMSLVNEKLYTYGDSTLSINLEEFVMDMVQHSNSIFDSQKIVEKKIHIPHPIRISRNIAIPFGLILSELITNSFKHAFTASSVNPIIQIQIFVENKTLFFSYTDNGKGLQQQAVEPTTNYSHGVLLIKDLIRQLKGTLATKSEAGLHYSFIIPI